MSRESVPCVTRTFMCDNLRRSSSWLEIGSLETNFRICPCRNRLCTFSAMVALTLCTHLHNYAGTVRPCQFFFTIFENSFFTFEFELDAADLFAMHCSAGVSPAFLR